MDLNNSGSSLFLFIIFIFTGLEVPEGGDADGWEDDGDWGDLEVRYGFCMEKGLTEENPVVLWIHIGFKADPDPAFYQNAGPDQLRIQGAKPMRIRIRV